MPLTDIAIRNTKAADRTLKLSDGGGLYLQVTTKGSRLWRMNYRFARRQKTLAFGAYPTLSLAQARARRDEAKRLLAEGIDPGEHAKRQRAKRDVEANTFGAVAEELLVKRDKDGLSEVTLGKARWLLEFTRAELWHRPLAEISAADVLAVLRKVEARGTHESANDCGRPLAGFSDTASRQPELRTTRRSRFEGR